MHAGRNSWWHAAGVAAALWLAIPGDAEIVYNNVGSTNSQPAYYPSTAEYGDELTLAGVGRDITGFRTEYYGDFPATNEAFATIRFYANDGPGTPPVPRTLLFQSDPLPLSRGYRTIILENLAVTVSNVFTWTIEFTGLTGQNGNLTGLILYDPPSVGFSYDDFWQRDGTNWTRLWLGGSPKANFAARVIARDDLTVELEHAEARPGGQFGFHLVGLVGRTCIVQASADLTNWASIGLFEFTQPREEFVDTNAPAGRRFYRALTTVGGPMRFGASARTTNGLVQIQVGGPERIPFALQGSADFVSWTNLTTNTFTSRPLVFVDPDSASTQRRFYRTRLIP